MKVTKKQYLLKEVAALLDCELAELRGIDWLSNRVLQALINLLKRRLEKDQD